MKTKVPKWMTSIKSGFSEYQKMAIKTAIYDQKVALEYTALGLAGETGEYVEKVKRLIRGDININEEMTKQMAMELGDILWYCANCANVLGIDFGTIALQNIEKLKDRKKRNVLKGKGDNR